jgi:phosphatidylinositol alpha-1,6-mannosyltransferase
MSEIARRYPAGELIVSTGTLPGGAEADRAFGNQVARLVTPSSRLRTLAGQIQWSRQAFELDRRHRFRFAWCDNIRPSAYPANLLARRRQVPYGVILHGSDLFDLRRNFRRRWFKRLVARRLLGDAAVLVTNSQWTAQLTGEVLDELGLDRSPSRIQVVSLGTDPTTFRPEIDPTSFRSERGLPAGPWLVTVARLELYKGADVGIRAVRLLADRGLPVHYAIVGDGPARPELETLARSEQVADRVHFLGRVPENLLPEAYRLADIYLGITRQTEVAVEGFGISLVEAQAAGVPVIAGRGGGTADAVADGETGLLVDPLDAKAVADAVESLLADPTRRAAMGRAGRQAVEAHYNWDRVVADLRSISAQLGVWRDRPNG